MKVINLYSIKKFFKQIFQYKILNSAAELSFHMLLSFFPVLILLNAIVGMLNIDIEWLTYIVRNFIPEQTLDMIEGYLEYLSGQESFNYLLLGIFLCITSIDSIIITLKHKIRELYGTDKKQNFIKEWFFSALMIVLIIAAIYLSLLLLVFGKTLFSYLETLFSFPDFLSTILEYLRYALTAFFLFLFIYLLYRFTPRANLKFKDVIFGTLFSTVFWITASYIFSLYVNQIGRYSLIYGTIGAIIVLMLWIYILNIILLLGMHINYYLYKQKTNS